MRNMLLKRMFVTCLLLVTFFSIGLSVSAANFKYADFNWEEFLEQNKQYWVTSCDEGDEKCYDRIIKTQEKFYKKLYKLLAKYEKKDILIDDNVIIETVFFGLTPDIFNDPVGGEDNPYNLDEDEDSFIASDDGNIRAAREYFEAEKNSLKTLMNNMVGYMQPCYGVSDITPTIVNNVPSCENGLVPDGDRCVKLLDTYEVTFFERIYQNVDIFGLIDSENEKQCEEKAEEEGYTISDLGPISGEQIVNLDLYWDFLSQSNYFDKKSHLQSYFQYVLDSTGHKTMSELNKTEYEEYEEDIVIARQRIIAGIQSVLKSYESEMSNVSMLSGRASAYWWPIGSSETTVSDGVTMAIGEPESVNVTSKYGLRTHPVTGEANSMHNGIDISGTEGSTNIIAAREGTVVSIIDDNGGSCVAGDSDCGGTYGNYIIIQHIDNNYTLYAHMATSSLTVKPGDTVKQGQVIGKVGNTGRSTGGHLHFEVRVGGNDITSTQDPLLFVSAEKPRIMDVQSDLLEWLGVMEGTGPTEGNNYVVYNDSGGVATFGHGITIINHGDTIRSYGIDPNTLSVGSLVPMDVADSMYNKIVQEEMDAVKSAVSAKGLSLSDNQLAALIALKYNAGNINDFYEPYNKYGSTEDLCTNWWENYALHDRKGNYLDGLKSRRIAECDAFVNGVYNNPY